MEKLNPEPSTINGELTGKEKKAIVVLGAGRCGTSLLMQVLSRIGMTVSDVMTPASEQNPDGGYEDSEVFALQSEMLAALETNQLIPLPDRWQDHSELSPLKKQLQNVLVKRINDAPTIFGVKDPRTAMFLPLWKQIFNPQKIVPIYILAVRSPASSVRSLVMQYNQGEMISEVFWLSKYCDALTHTGSNCFIVHYEDWFTRPIEQARELLSYTGLDEFFTGDVGEALNGVIKPNLNRAIYEDYNIKNQFVINLYEALKQCRADTFDRENLMAAVRDCRTAMHGFKGWYMEAHKCYGLQIHTKSVIEKLQAREKENRDRIEKLQAREKENRDRIEKLQAREKNRNDKVAEINHYRKKIQTPYKIISQLETVYFGIKYSFTLQAGNFLVRMLDLVLFRKKSVAAIECLDRIFYEFRQDQPVFEPGQKEVVMFTQWMEQIDKRFVQLFDSRGWKTGKFFVSTMRTLFFKRKESIAEDQIDHIFNQFEHARKAKR